MTGVAKADLIPAVDAVRRIDQALGVRGAYEYDLSVTDCKYVARLRSGRQEYVSFYRLDEILTRLGRPDLLQTEVAA